MGTIVGVVCSAFASVISGMVLYIVKRGQDKADKREEDRNEREELTLKSLHALFGTTKELVDCVLYKKPPNGEMESAYNYKQDVKHELEDYERRRASRS